MAEATAGPSRHSQLPLRPKRVSSRWCRDHPRWSRVNNLSVKQQIQEMRHSEPGDRTINFLTHNAPLDDEVRVVEHLLRTSLIPRRVLRGGEPSVAIMLYANAVHWTRATSWHRIIAALEADLQQLHLPSHQLERTLLYDKLDGARAAFHAQLRVAERGFLMLKGVEKKDGDVFGEGGEEESGAQRRMFEHALAVVRLCTIVEEVDELGDEEEEEEVEREYARLCTRFEEGLEEVQLLEIAVRIESTKG